MSAPESSSNNSNSPADGLTRRGIPCSQCRLRHVACYSPGESLIADCARCLRLKLECDAIRAGLSPESAAQSNDLAELRSQVKRLHAVVENLEKPRPRNSGTEVDTLVDRLTNLCFSGERLDGPQASVDDADLVENISLQLDTDIPVKEDSLDSGGFCFSEETEKHDWPTLIAQLPPWPELRDILADIGTKWIIYCECVLTPRSPRRIEEVYRLGERAPVDEIAELFALLACHSACCGVNVMFTPQAAERFFKQAERYSALAREALELADYEPTFHVIRTLYFLAYMDIAGWKDPSRYKAGLAILPILLSLTWQAGLNYGDDHFPNETALERYDRRALANAIVRHAWYFMPPLNRATAFGPSSFHCPLPEPLSEDDCPIDELYESYRPSPASIRGVRLRTDLAKIRIDMQNKLNSRVVEQPDMKELTRRLNVAYAEDFSAGDWKIAMDPETGLMAHVVSFTQMTRQDALARSMSQSWYPLVSISLHQHFLFQPDTRQAQWHRDQMMQSLRLLNACMQEGMALVGPLPSLCFVNYQSLVATSLLLSSLSSMPLSQEDAAICRHITSLYFKHRSISGVPRATVRLVRLAAFLLDGRQNAKEQIDTEKRKKEKLESKPVQKAIPWEKPAEQDPTPFTFSQYFAFPDENDPEDYVSFGAKRRAMGVI